MKIHFICRGNVLRSIIAETYLDSLRLAGLEVSSSGVLVDYANPSEQGFFANTISLLALHDIAGFAKSKPDQLIQDRVVGQDITVCMNRRVFDEAIEKVALPIDTIIWDITDIGEGHRAFQSGVRGLYEEEIYQEISYQINGLIADHNLS